ncbi:hypothetical protein V6N11_003539 [Hibiscus sabdariffa]|uniref:Bulb-type lectin domain-containing protein n=1 Tax=Hibiscus sabdariffa TaxID=183260 RepID=A0ABR2SE94_9ROSI
MRTKDPDFFPLSNHLYVNDFLSLKNELAIADDSDRIIWSTPRFESPVALLQLDDSDNLVLLDEQNVSLWESFGYPTDTLVMVLRLAVRVEGDDLLAVFDGRSSVHRHECAGGFRVGERQWFVLVRRRRFDGRLQGDIGSY